MFETCRRRPAGSWKDWLSILVLWFRVLDHLDMISQLILKCTELLKLSTWILIAGSVSHASQVFAIQWSVWTVGWIKWKVMHLWRHFRRRKLLRNLQFRSMQALIEFDCAAYADSLKSKAWAHAAGRFSTNHISLFRHEQVHVQRRLRLYTSPALVAAGS